VIHTFVHARCRTHTHQLVVIIHAALYVFHTAARRLLDLGILLWFRLVRCSCSCSSVCFSSFCLRGYLSLSTITLPHSARIYLSPHAPYGTLVFSTQHHIVSSTQLYIILEHLDSHITPYHSVLHHNTLYENN
jgi:hypothetical protein